MLPELYRRARRAEAGVQRAEDRRRRRLDFFRAAITDGPSRTSMQEARLVVGDRRLFGRFARVLRDNVYRHDFEQFLATTLGEREQRYRKYGASPYIGEPNIKESAGGLRDMHTAMWLAAAKFGTRTLRELNDKGLITPREQAHTDAALTFLWRVRHELHFLAGHQNDVLGRDVQPALAPNFGYEGDERSLDVERFMREYYLHARAIHRVSRRLIARCQETVTVRGAAERRNRHQALADGLVFIDGRLHLADRDSAVFATDPTRLMKVFWHLHRLGCELSLELERAVEDSLDLIDDGFRRSPVVRELFLDICRTWGRVAVTLSEMHELGVLGRYLPEFGALTCLVQYDVYHKFSADQHSLLAVEHMEALAPGQSAESEGAAQGVSEVEKPELLMLGMLLHDIGKAKGHGHVKKGIPLIQALCTRLDLPAAAAAVVEFLVAHHLTMSHVAQRRDIDDPKTIADFAAAVGDPQRLRMLYLLTWADMRAVGPGVLTPWQAVILHELYARTIARVTGGRPQRPHPPGLAHRVAPPLQQDGSLQAGEGPPGPVSERYLATTSAQRLAQPLRLLERRRAAGRLPTGVPESPRISIDNTLSDAFAVVEVKCPDRLGMLYLSTRTLSACGLDIGSVPIATEIDQAYDTFYVHDGQDRRVEDPDALERLRQALEQALVQPL